MRKDDRHLSERRREENLAQPNLICCKPNQIWLNSFSSKHISTHPQRFFFLLPFCFCLVYLFTAFVFCFFCGMVFFYHEGGRPPLDVQS